MKTRTVIRCVVEVDLSRVDSYHELGAILIRAGEVMQQAPYHNEEPTINGSDLLRNPLDADALVGEYRILKMHDFGVEK